MKVETQKKGYNNEQIQALRKQGFTTEQIRAKLRSENTQLDAAFKRDEATLASLRKEKQAAAAMEDQGLAAAGIGSSGGKGSPAMLAYAQNHPKAKKIFGVDFNELASGASESVGNLGSSFLSSSQSLNSRSAVAYSKVFANFTGPAGAALGGVAGGIDDFSNSITGTLDKLTEQINTNLEPISDFMGSTLGTITGVIQDPLGPNGLGNVATRLLNSVSPGFGDKVNGLNKTLNLEAMARFPSQVMAGVNHLMEAVNNLLAIPLSILSEIYYGLMSIIKSISKMINSIMDGFMQLILNFLDSIIPIKSIMGLLDAVSGLANQIGGLAGAFNLSMVTDITSQITGFTDQFTSILNNPLDFAMSFAPPGVSSFLNGLQNPEALVGQFLPAEVSGFIDNIQNPQDLIKQFLPPQMAQAFDKISDMTGFGYNGNMGFGFASALKQTQGSVLSSILSQNQKQAKVLAPLLAGQAEMPETQQPKLLEGGLNPHLYNEARNQQPQYVKSSGKGKEGTVSAYGMTYTGPLNY
jgi:DNA-binding transcriptional MerR regulator